jgi:hypothetical protein
MTTAALKGIDSEGGIDNYILNLDERSVAVRSSVHQILRSKHFSSGFKLHNKDTINYWQCPLPERHTQ